MLRQLVVSMPDHYRAVIFDLFGTLVPCYPLADLRSVLCHMAADLGVTFEFFEREWSATFELRLRSEISSVYENLKYILATGAFPQDVQKLDVASKRRLDFERTTLSPRLGTLEALCALRRRGVKLGLITNCSIETVEVWHLSALAPYFDHAAFSCMERAAKPEPEIYLRTVAALGLHPRNCIFVGDGSSNELQGAADVGMRPVLIRSLDDDGGFPGRIDAGKWKGEAITDVQEILQLVD